MKDLAIITTMAGVGGDEMETGFPGTNAEIDPKASADKPEAPRGPPWFEDYLKTRDASVPVRDMPPTEQMEYTLKEEDVGITEYVAAGVKGFEAIIKHRFSDFNVNEIDREGNVTKLKSMKVPEEKSDADVVDSSKWPKHSELTAAERGLVTSLQWIRILELAKKNLQQDKPADEGTVTIDITTKEKPERKVIHDLIRKTFDHLQTDFTEKDGKKHIAVSRKRKEGKTKSGHGEWPRDLPKYLHFTLYKENQDTHMVLNILANILKKDRKGFGIAGTKDKRARTAQRVSIAFVTPRSLVRSLQEVRQKERKFREKRNMKEREIIINAGDFNFEKTGLELGHLSGNRFSLVLRNCVAESDGVIDAALSSVMERGFINYFGLQRFGTSAVKTSDVGLAMIKEKWEEAVDLVLKPRANERHDMALCRRIWWQYRDANMALKVLSTKGTSIEAKLLFGMKSTKQRCHVSALNMIPKHSRLMYLHSYQSLIWNRVVSRRLKEFGTKVLAGDLFIEEAKTENIPVKEENDESEDADELESAESSKWDVGVVTEENMEGVSIYDIVMPVPGCKVSYPENAFKRFYQEELEADGLGLDRDAFINKSDSYTLGGGYRKVLAKAEDMTWRHVKYSDPNGDLTISDIDRLDGKPEIESEVDGAYNGLVVEFNLKSSSYATMALREALKSGTGKVRQSQLTAKHLEEHEEKLAKEKAEDENVDSNGEPEAKKAKLVES